MTDTTKKPKALSTRIAAPSIPSRTLLSEGDPDTAKEHERITQEELERTLNERLRKLPLLFDKFRISQDKPEKWFMLALALAIKHEPGFQFQQPSGRPNKWDSQLLPLWATVQLAIAKKEISVSNACKNLATTYKDRGITKKNIEDRYHEAAKLKNAVAYKKMLDDFPHYRDEVMSTLAKQLDPELFPLKKPSRKYSPS